MKIKEKAPYFLFFLGLLLVLGSFWLSTLKEKQAYQNYLENQQSNLLQAWNSNWISFLENNAKIEDDSDASLLLISEYSNELLEDFFVGRADPVPNWKNYRTLATKEKQKFLVEILKEPSSLDRAMAIKEWQKIFGELPSLELSPYEKSLFIEEKKSAYQLLFEHKSKINFDQLSSDKFKFMQVLSKYADEDDEDVILYVPSLKYIRDILHPKFLELNPLIATKITNSPFQLDIDKNINPFLSKNIYSRIIFGVGIVTVIFGLLLISFRFSHRSQLVEKQISFLHQLMHEIKTPLTGIRLNSELLLKYGFDQQLVTALLDSSQRLHNFFEEIITINAEKRSLEKQKLDNVQIGDFFSKLISEFHPHLVLSIESIHPANFDPIRMRIILRNLMKNAVRFGKAGTLFVNISASEICIIVEDEGKGVKLEDAKIIFRQFYRSEESYKISPDGMGLGLSIAKQLADEMKFELYVENPGQNKARFVLKGENINDG